MYTVDHRWTHVRNVCKEIVPSDYNSVIPCYIEVAELVAVAADDALT